MKHHDFPTYQLQSNATLVESQAFEVPARILPLRPYGFAKRAFDCVVSLLLLPLFAICCLVLKLLNRGPNAGPLFYVQLRMGQDCKAFRAIKFRSMKCADRITRGADDPLELDRITPLGRFLRKARIDEIPQIINVLRGEMSLIGPRPDYYKHARVYLKTIPGYRERHAVRPGISGYAQTEVGYVQGLEATRAKVRADLHYIAHQNFWLDTWLVWRTVSIVLGRRGA
ncbi:sugar transferase [Sulfitobacter aestuarii]|uniref:Sugar transferase n=1 Tax=Sulfitobacter aestuarii TaxID=2161676 RepID=A0ABW5U2U0_9RHOB